MVRERADLADQEVCETYTCDSDGVITVSIRRLRDEHRRTYEVFRGREQY